jgi:hypothetical protein
VTPTLVLILAGALLGFAAGYAICRRGAEQSLEYVSAIHRVWRQREYERGRWRGWHEPHSCDTACLDRILGPVAKTTSTDPSRN